MPKRQRRDATNKRWWHRSSYMLTVIVLSMTSSISAAQRSARVEQDRGDDTVDAGEQAFRREKMKEVRERILESTGSVIWDGLEECGVELKPGVPHVGNRRNLKSVLSQLKFTPKDLDVRTRAAGKGPRRKSSKKLGKGGKGGNSRPPPPPPIPKPRPPPSRPPPPHPSPTPPPRPPSPTPPTPGRCIEEITVDFLQLSAIPPALFVNPNDPDEQALGTRYVYSDGLRDQETLDELAGSKVSGTCTRTQARVGNPDVGLQLGRGYCQFIYVLRDSRDREITFTAAGDVADTLGGILPITGGSQSTVGAYGEIELLPVNLVDNGQFEIAPGDFFLDPLFYLADARILVPCD